MLRYHSYNIVFQEVPGEVTLAINITNCPNGCKGCHSAYLQQDIGDILDKSVLDNLLVKYGGAITCVCFMGGDADTTEVNKLTHYIKELRNHSLKTAWYSGKSTLPKALDLNQFDFIKLGPYVEKLGGLDVASTNQRYYQINNGTQLIDKTYIFQKKTLK